MKKETIEKIRDNAAVADGETVIGAYTYKVNNSGEIIRCKTSEIGKMWIDNNGYKSTAWEIVNA